MNVGIFIEKLSETFNSLTSTKVKMIYNMKRGVYVHLFRFQSNANIPSLEPHIHKFLKKVHLCILFLQIELGPSEFVTAVYGTVGPFGNYSSVITSLRFVTNAGKYGPFGQGIGTHFQAPMHKGSSSIVGFFGRSSSCVESIGFYVVPV